MNFATRKDGRVYNSSRYRKTGKVIQKDTEITKKSESVILRAELKREQERLRRIKKNKIVELKRQQKNRAIRESIARIRKEQSLLNALNSNRISPERVEHLRSGTTDLQGSQYTAILGLGNNAT